MQYLIGILIGLAIGLFINVISLMFKTFGTFEIDTTKDDKDIFRLNWERDPHDISRKKYIVFKVYKTNLKSIEDESIPDKIAKK